jgi:hypothetical protein
MPLQATSGAASYDAFGGGVAAVPNYIEEVFQTWLYTGNGSTQTITNGIDLAGEGGLVWTKTRSNTYANGLYDTARGAGVMLRSDSTSANNTTGELSAFGATGFSVSYNSLFAQTNANGATYVSWTFRKQPKFFDVVTYTGTGANRTVAHALGSVPGCIMVKRTDTTGAWQVYHRSNSNTQYMVLNSTAAVATGATRWNSTTPTATEFSLGTDTTVNASGGTYVAYLFAHDAGGFGLTGTDNVISCGSWNVAVSGALQTIDLGYEPQWLLIKRTNSNGAWFLFDNMRGVSNPGPSIFLNPNSSDAESSASLVSFLANGFSSTIGGSGETFIYIAIRRGPMKVPTDGTKVFNSIARTGTGAVAQVTGVGFAPDLAIVKARDGREGEWFDRLRGKLTNLRIPGAYAEQVETNSLTGFDYMDGVSFGADSNAQTNASGVPFINHFFRRAPGFFDVVCYTGNDVAGRTVAHNLAAIPELMIARRRDVTASWIVYHKDLGSGKLLVLNSTGTTLTDSSYWSAAPTSSVFTPGAALNATDGTLVSYLFSSLSGVSKVGSYTGTGASDQVINCGFTGGARFVLIKATSTTGNWLVWDSARGIVAGNDPYLALNSTAAEVTNTDWVDTAASGFELSNAGGNLANSNGVSSIYLAIA